MAAAVYAVTKRKLRCMDHIYKHDRDGWLMGRTGYLLVGNLQIFSRVNLHRILPGSFSPVTARPPTRYQANGRQCSNQLLQPLHRRKALILVCLHLLQRLIERIPPDELLTRNHVILVAATIRAKREGQLIRSRQRPKQAE